MVSKVVMCLLSVGMTGHATMEVQLPETTAHLREQAFRWMPSNQRGVAVFDVDVGAACDWLSAM
jgi:hypothetical protein